MVNNSLKEFGGSYFESIGSARVSEVFDGAEIRLLFQGMYWFYQVIGLEDRLSSGKKSLIIIDIYPKKSIEDKNRMFYTYHLSELF